MKNHLLLFLVFLSANLFSNEFVINENPNSEVSSLLFNIGEYSIEQENSYNKISSTSRGETQNHGEPLLPTYSINYAIDRNKDYDVNFVVTDVEIYNNIILYPVQPIQKNENNKDFVKNDELYNSNSSYPLSQLNVSRSSLRGYELLGIELIPFEYNFEQKKLKVYKTVEINIEEIGTRQGSSTPRSQMFEDMYSNIIINTDSYHDNRNFQKPSILYILENYTSAIEPLVEWRRKQGFEVVVADRDDTGSSTSSIKNYITNAYNNWANPPEFVCLVGDANGSLEVATYNVGEGGGWWGAYGEGDFPYTLIEGNDYARSTSYWM